VAAADAGVVGAETPFSGGPGRARMPHVEHVLLTRLLSCTVHLDWPDPVEGNEHRDAEYRLRRSDWTA
jgi:hypothetical protein